jgi:saccharopine dehydrogenase (NADP+, L-glutamate forming)
LFRAIITRIKDIAQFTSEEESARIIAGMRWLSLFSSSPAPITAKNLLDTLCIHLSTVLLYAPGERDLVVLQHKFVVEWQNGDTVCHPPSPFTLTCANVQIKETFTSTLELLGNPTGYSAMAWSVGITCGIATQLVLDGHPEVKKAGVWAPYTREMGDAIRDVLEEEGLRVVEERVG